MSKQFTTWLLIALLAATLLATVCLYLMVDTEQYSWELMLTVRTLWGVWIVALVAVILTRVTIFGWSFRRYFRWDREEPPPPAVPRPARAPWNKGAASSFGFTVSMVSVTGVAAVAIVVLWMLEGVTGRFVFWLASTITGTVWWVTVITLVLARVAIFGAQRSKKKQQAEAAASAEGKT